MRLHTSHLKEVIRDIFIAKRKFSDIQGEICIRPGNTVNDTLIKQPFFMKRDTRRLTYYESKTHSDAVARDLFKVKRKPTRSIHSKLSFQSMMN